MTMRIPYVLLGRSDDLHLTATTTGVNETVTITQMQMLRGSYINWGDGQVTNLPVNSTAAINHVYASAGTYPVRVGYRRAIRSLHLDAGKVGGLNTCELVESPILNFYLNLVPNCVVRSADMVNWRPNIWILTSLKSTGSYAIDSAHMVDWRPTSWFMADMATAGSYTINSAHMAAWSPILWYLYSMYSGNYIIDTAHTVSWRPIYFQLRDMPAGSYSFAASCMRNWTGIQVINCANLSLSEGQVDGIINDLYAGKPTFTYATPSLNIGGNNAAPSGSYQSVCPPTSGLEMVHDLANDICTPHSAAKWTITYTGGTAP